MTNPEPPKRWMLPGFDPQAATIPVLREILQHNKIKMSRLKVKKDFVEAFNREVAPIAPKLLEEHLRAKPSAGGVMSNNLTSEKVNPTSAVPPPTTFNPQTASKAMLKDFLYEADPTRVIPTRTTISELRELADAKVKHLQAGTEELKSPRKRVSFLPGKSSNKRPECPNKPSQTKDGNASSPICTSSSTSNPPFKETSKYQTVCAPTDPEKAHIPNVSIDPSSTSIKLPLKEMPKSQAVSASTDPEEAHIPNSCKHPSLPHSKRIPTRSVVPKESSTSETEFDESLSSDQTDLTNDDSTSLLSSPESSADDSESSIAIAGPGPSDMVNDSETGEEMVDQLDECAEEVPDLTRDVTLPIKITDQESLQPPVQGTEKAQTLIPSSCPTDSKYSRGGAVEHTNKTSESPNSPNMIDLLSAPLDPEPLAYFDRSSIAPNYLWKKLPQNCVHCQGWSGLGNYNSSTGPEARHFPLSSLLGNVIPPIGASRPAASHFPPPLQFGNVAPPMIMPQLYPPFNPYVINVPWATAPTPVLAMTPPMVPTFPTPYNCNQGPLMFPSPGPHPAMMCNYACQGPPFAYASPHPTSNTHLDHVDPTQLPSSLPPAPHLFGSFAPACPLQTADSGAIPSKTPIGINIPHPPYSAASSSHLPHPTPAPEFERMNYSMSLCSPEVTQFHNLQNATSAVIDSTNPTVSPKPLPAVGTVPYGCFAEPFMCKVAGTDLATSRRDYHGMVTNPTVSPSPANYPTKNHLPAPGTVPQGWSAEPLKFEDAGANPAKSHRPCGPTNMPDQANKSRSPKHERYVLPVPSQRLPATAAPYMERVEVANPHLFKAPEQASIAPIGSFLTAAKYHCDGNSASLLTSKLTRASSADTSEPNTEILVPGRLGCADDNELGEEMVEKLHECAEEIPDCKSLMRDKPGESTTAGHARINAPAQTASTVLIAAPNLISPSAVPLARSNTDLPSASSSSSILNFSVKTAVTQAPVASNPTNAPVPQTKVAVLHDTAKSFLTRVQDTVSAHTDRPVIPVKCADPNTKSPEASPLCQPLIFQPASNQSSDICGKAITNSNSDLASDSSPSGIFNFSVKTAVAQPPVASQPPNAPVPWTQVAVLHDTAKSFLTRVQDRVSTHTDCPVIPVKFANPNTNSPDASPLHQPPLIFQPASTQSSNMSGKLISTNKKSSCTFNFNAKIPSLCQSLITSSSEYTRARNTTLPVSHFVLPVPSRITPPPKIITSTCDVQANKAHVLSAQPKLPCTGSSVAHDNIQSDVKRTDKKKNLHSFFNPLPSFEVPAPSPINPASLTFGFFPNCAITKGNQIQAPSSKSRIPIRDNNKVQNNHLIKASQSSISTTEPPEQQDSSRLSLEIAVQRSSVIISSFPSLKLLAHQLHCSGKETTSYSAATFVMSHSHDVSAPSISITSSPFMHNLDCTTAVTMNQKPKFLVSFESDRKDKSHLYTPKSISFVRENQLDNSKDCRDKEVSLPTHPHFYQAIRLINKVKLSLLQARVSHKTIDKSDCLSPDPLCNLEPRFTQLVDNEQPPASVPHHNLSIPNEAVLEVRSAENDDSNVDKNPQEHDLDRGLLAAFDHYNASPQLQIAMPEPDPAQSHTEIINDVAVNVSELTNALMQSIIPTGPILIINNNKDDQVCIHQDD